MGKAQIKESKVERVLTFTLDGHYFALDISLVREILEMTDITRIPQAPSFMRGVANLRGNAVPVMDMRHRFGMPSTEHTVYTRIIIVEIKLKDETLSIGAIADSVKEVLAVELEEIQQPPKMGTKIDVNLIRGIVKQDNRFVTLLNVDKVFDIEALVNSQASGQNG